MPEAIDTRAVTIRKPTASDARAIVMLSDKERRKLYSAFLQEFGEDYYRHDYDTLQNEITAYRERLQYSQHLERYCAFIGDTLVGYIVCRVSSENELQLHGIYVDSDVHGKGIGTKLMNYIFNLHHAEVCKLRVISQNVRAIKFYEKFGFEPNGNVSLFRGILEKIEMERSTPKHHTN